MRSRAAVALLAALAASCGARLMKLPSGPGTPLSTQVANDSLVNATPACANPPDLTAEVAVSGSAGGHRLRGRLLVGIASRGLARIEAVAPFGQPLFIFTTSGDNATLLLPRDGRVLTDAPSRDVLDAVAGVPLSVSDLQTVLTGCPQGYSLANGFAAGEDWRVIRASGGPGWKTIYLRRESASRRWRIAAILPDDAPWRVDYLAYLGDVPRSVQLTSVNRSGPTRFNLVLTMSQVDTNASLGPEVFSIQIPPDAEPITLEELRRSGPLAP